MFLIFVLFWEFRKITKKNLSISECLEHLWKMRFYDQLLLKKIRCEYFFLENMSTKILDIKLFF